MQRNRLLMAGFMGALLVFILAGCGPTGGTLTLINESSYEVSSPRISMGDKRIDSLVPGQWMKSSVDKNGNFNVEFNSSDKDKLKMSHSGNWTLGKWISGLIAVDSGNEVIVVIMNKNGNEE